MLHFVRWKQIAIVLTVVLGVLLVMPNFFSKETVANWPWWVPRPQLNLGLDLRGGAHLLLSMETAEVRKDWLDTLRDDARKRLREAKIGFTGLGIANNAVQVRLAKPEDADAALKELRRLLPADRQPHSRLRRHRPRRAKAEGGVIIIAPTEPGLQHRIANAISAAIETVRRRVDAMGTAEAQIVRQGSDRILVQVPGLQDTAQLKELIGKTARLTFHEVHPTISAEEAKQTASAGRLQGLCRAPTGRRATSCCARRRSCAATSSSTRSRASTSAPTSRSSPSASTVRRPQVRQVHQGQRRPPVRHRARRQGDLGAGDPRADPRRLRPDQRQLHGRDRQQARHPAALRRAAGQAHHRRGAHRRSLARRRLHRGRQARRHSSAVSPPSSSPSSPTARSASSPCVGLIVHGLLIVALMTVIGSTLTLPGIAGLVLDHRHGGRRQRADLRAHPRGAARGKYADRRHRCRLHARLHHHRRQPAHDARLRRPGHVLAGLRSDPRLRRDADASAS